MDEDLQVREGIAEGFILNMHPIRIRIRESETHQVSG